MDHSDALCRFVRSYVGSWEVAKDLVDDVFLQLWLRLGRLEREGDLKAYLFAAAKNHAVSYLRRRAVERRHYRASQVSAMILADATSPAAQDQRMLADELTATIQREVDALPPRQREVMLLKWERQATHEEIARLLGIAPKTVAEHFRRALEHLRRALPRDIGSGNRHE